MKTRFDIDCEQSLSFPSVFPAFLRASVELSSGEMQMRTRARTWRKRKKKETVFFPASPHSLFVSFPNLHNFN